MKKIILTSLMLFVVSLCSFAGSDVSVTQGDKKFFKTASGTAILEFVFDGATYDDKMPLEKNEKFKDMANVKEIAWNGFKQNFDEKNKGKVNLVKEGQANYKITVKVTKMDQFFNVMGWVPAPATKMWGVVTITDTSSGSVLLTATVKGLDGGSNPTPDGTISDCFEELGEQIAKLK